MPQHQNQTQWSAWATQTFLTLAKAMHRPVDEVSFHRVPGDLVEVIVRRGDNETAHPLSLFLFKDNDNMRTVLKKELRRIVRNSLANPSRRGERKGSASPPPLPQEVR